MVRFKGKSSSVKNLQGGRPQGILLGLLLFIVLSHDIGLEDQGVNVGDLITSKNKLRSMNELNLKNIDDLTLAEVIDLLSQLSNVGTRPLPDSYHAKTGVLLDRTDPKSFNSCQKQKNIQRQMT